MGDAGVLVALVLWQPAFAVVTTHSETAGHAGGIEHVRLCVWMQKALTTSTRSSACEVLAEFVPFLRVNEPAEDATQIRRMRLSSVLNLMYREIRVSCGTLSGCRLAMSACDVTVSYH